MNKWRCAAVLLLPLVGFSCAKVKGEFAFKKFHDYSFKRVHGLPEFSSAEDIGWIYRFKKSPGKKKIGVLIKKKEIIWVDVFTSTEMVDRNNRIVRGEIKGLGPGDYKIVLSDITSLDSISFIDEQKFLIYNNDGDSFN